MPSLAGLVAPADAAPPPTFVALDRDASDRADELVKRGLAFAKADRYAEAEPLVREAWGLKRSYDIAANLGIVEAALRKWRDAAEHLTFALKTFPANGKPEHRKLLEQTLAKAAAEVGALSLKVNVDKAELFIDGKSVGLAPLGEVVFVEPGARVLEAKLSGYVSARKELRAEKGGALAVALELSPVKVVPVPQPSSTVGGGDAPPPLVEEGGANRAVLVTGGVAAGGALIAGVVLTVLSNGKGSEADTAAATLRQAGEKDPCSTHATDCTSIDSALQARDAMAKGAMVSFILAGAAGAGTALYGLLAPKPSTRKPSTGLRLIPVVGASQGGLIVTGAW
jgi:tetratricopeptide (TPR) repeat protein